MSRVNVLVVGAGPTGLMMAAELIRHGLTCRIIDSAAEASTQSKAIAIQARTLEILQHAGIVDPFLEQGLKLHAGNIMSHKKKVTTLSFTHIPSPYPFVLSLEQNHTEAILAKHLRSKGVRIERSVELTKFKQNKDFVEVSLTHRASGAKEIILVDWMVGCDGAHSIIRKEIGARFSGKLFQDVFSLADVEIDWDLPHDQFTAFIEGEGVLAAPPLPGEHRYRLIFQLKRCRNLLKSVKSHRDGILDATVAAPPTLEEVQELLDRYVGKGVKAKNPTWLANFHINSRLASRFQDRRVFLAGDAAHIHSPVGGQGMNTGIQDAFNLAWKLALVQSGKVKAGLLGSYEIERRGVGERLLNLTEKASAMVTMHNPIMVRIRNFLIRNLTKLRSIQAKITQEISELAIHYPHSPLNDEIGPFMGKLKPGDRAPDGSVILNNASTSLFGVWKGLSQGIVLFFTGDRTDLLDDMGLQADELEAKFPVKVFIIAPTPALNPTQRILLDPDLCVHEAYGIDEPSLYFIRPDLYIGYRQVGIKKNAFFNYMKKALGICA